MSLDIVIELGPETRKFIRELCGRGAAGSQEIIEDVVDEYNKRLKTQRKEMGAVFERKLRAEVGKPGGAADADPGGNSGAALKRLRERAEKEAAAPRGPGLKDLPLCACGCGRPVTKRRNKVLRGHASGPGGRKIQPRSFKRLPFDLMITDGTVVCPRVGKRTAEDDCTDCTFILTKIKNPETGLRYIRCSQAGGQK